MKRLLLLLCMLAGNASAQSFGASDWTIVRRSVVLRVSLPQAAVGLIDRQSHGAQRGTVPRYVLGHVDVHAGDTPCPAVDQGEGIGQIDTLAPLPGLLRYEVAFVCTAPGEMRLGDHILFDQDDDHLDFGILHSSAAQLLLFDAGHQGVLVRASGAPAGASLARFIRLGAAQVLASLVRIAIILLLVLQLRGRADWIAGAAALIIGAAGALALARLGIAAPRPEPADATLQLLLLLLAIRATAAERRTAAFATLMLVVGTLTVIEMFLRHAGMVRVLLGETLLAPVLLTQRPQTRRAGFLLPAALLGSVGDASFGDALRQLGLPSSAAGLPELGHEIGALSALVLIALTAAAAARILGRLRAPVILASAPGVVRTGLAGYSVFCLVKTLQA